jgi:hypothetical protein
MNQILLNGRVIRANIVSFEEGEEGWVEFEDLSLLKSANSQEVSDPNEASKESIADLTTSSIKLPTKKLYGTVEVRHIPDIT